MDLIRLSSSEFQNRDLQSEAVEKRPGRALDLEDLYIILQSHPHDSEAALQLADRLKRSGRLPEAVKVLRSTLKIDNGFATLSAVAHAEYENGEDETAMLHYQAAVLVAPEDSPELFEIFKNLGNIYVRRGDLDSAEDNYNRAHRIQASSDVLFVNMGTLYVQRQAWDEALEKFRAALVLNMFNDKAWVGLAIGHRMKSDRELAWGNLEAALEYNPLNEAALTLALEWGVQEGRESRVLEMIRTFLIEGGWNEKISLAFCWLSWRRGDRMVAEIELERLLAVNPQHENALKLLQEMRISA